MISLSGLTPEATQEVADRIFGAIKDEGEAVRLLTENPLIKTAEKGRNIRAIYVKSPGEWSSLVRLWMRAGMMRNCPDIMWNGVRIRPYWEKGLN